TWSEAKVWFVGRVTHAEAACRLLESRAERSKAGDARTVWPEFAEFNCASCHHDLRVPDEGQKHPDWRGSEAYLQGRPLGVPPWQTIWPVTSAPGLEEPHRLSAKPVARPGWVTMESPRPAKAEAASAVAKPAAEALARQRVALVAAADAEVEREARAFFPPGAPLVPEWDTAPQLFLGLKAMEYTRSNGAPDAETVKAYQDGGNAFRARDWAGVERAFGRIRPR
ncbi:MAG: hypothetical protein K2V38_28110, partial [Gemmataceae bacterium]|nr:hypothetical protein [Gemmataceae bacterium]